jgi:predicted DNA-binding protein
MYVCVAVLRKREMFKEKIKWVYFDIDADFSEWLNDVSKVVGVTREQMAKEAIEAWIDGNLVIE